MKPKEFDDLVRQKFEQNEFGYNPKNWDRLAQELDGKSKKRNLIMWLWLPATGIAASVALALGVPALNPFHLPASSQSQQQIASIATSATEATILPAESASQQPTAIVAGNTHPATTAFSAKSSRHRATAGKTNVVYTAVTTTRSTGISMAAIEKQADPKNEIIPTVRFEPIVTKKEETEQKKKKIVLDDVAVNTFIPEDVAAPKAPKVSIILSGGINKGNLNSGYMAGATIRRMLNDKVYVEGDVAFASSDNTQRTMYQVETQSNAPVATAASAYTNAAGKSAKVESSKVTNIPTTNSIIKEQDISYNLYYAQVTPSIGYKIMKRLSIGAGPDFQKMLVDNRPAPSTIDPRTLQEAPSFDIGMMGKTEYALTQKVKAAVYYRKGINNVITPTGKFIDRDYLQFQVKCTIFNK